MEVTSAPLCKELIRFDLFISFSHMRSSHSPFCYAVNADRFHGNNNNLYDPDQPPNRIV